MNGLNETVSTMSLNETKDSEMIEENFNQNLSTLSNLSLEENQESKMTENISIKNGGAGIGKPMGSPKFDDFLKNFRIPAKYLKESHIQLNFKFSTRQCWAFDLSI